VPKYINVDSRSRIKYGTSFTGMTTFDTKPLLKERGIKGVRLKIIPPKKPVLTHGYGETIITLGSFGDRETWLLSRERRILKHGN